MFCLFLCRGESTALNFGAQAAAEEHSYSTHTHTHTHTHIIRGTLTLLELMSQESLGQCPLSLKRQEVLGLVNCGILGRKSLSGTEALDSTSPLVRSFPVDGVMAEAFPLERYFHVCVQTLPCGRCPWSCGLGESLNVP
jgi:hypothetical protein